MTSIFLGISVSMERATSSTVRLYLLRKARKVCNAAGLFVANYIYVLVANPALCELDPQCTPLGCSFSQRRRRYASVNRVLNKFVREAK